MRADPALTPSLFAQFVPLNALRQESQVELAKKAALKHAQPGEYLFRVGDHPLEAIFLVQGEVLLEDAAAKPLGRIQADAPQAQHRLAPPGQSKMAARCVTDVDYLSVDASLLDVMLTWDQTGSFEVGELGGGDERDDDWMGKLLQMRTFQLLPPSNLQAMFMRMEEVHANPGQVIVKQGDDGDYFYVIVSGRCMVTREQPNQKPVRLAELDSGSCFGEEALISEGKRNATVIALTRTRLMRLGKNDFRQLLTNSISRGLSFPEAQHLVASGKGRWLDVRLPSEFQAGHLAGAINIPLYMLRLKLSLLDPQFTWIVACDTGRRSSVAVFILTQKGYDALVLDKGIPQT